MKRQRSTDEERMRHLETGSREAVWTEEERKRISNLMQHAQSINNGAPLCVRFHSAFQKYQESNHAATGIVMKLLHTLFSDPVNLDTRGVVVAAGTDSEGHYKQQYTRLVNALDAIEFNVLPSAEWTPNLFIQQFNDWKPINIDRSLDILRNQV